MLQKTLFVTIATIALGTPLPAIASEIVATLTGTVFNGIDYSGVFGFSPNAALAGQNFTLVYTFDDTKGHEDVVSSQGVPYFSSVTSTSTSNPGTAVLTIGSGSFTFGVLNASEVAYSEALRYAPPADSEVYFLAGDGHYLEGSSVQASIYPANGTPPLSTSYDWRTSFSDSQLIGQTQFVIGEGAFNEYAGGELTVTSITVSGLPSTAPAAPEPATWALLGAGLAALGALARRRKKSRSL